MLSKATFFPSIAFYLGNILLLMSGKFRRSLGLLLRLIFVFKKPTEEERGLLEFPPISCYGTAYVPVYRRGCVLKRPSILSVLPDLLP